MMTALGGTLIRHGLDDWRWLDGERWLTEEGKPVVTDHRISSYYNFRCMAGYVCVPRRAVAQNDDLSWVPSLAVDVNVRGMAYMHREYYVPLAVWDAHNDSEDGVIACTWPKSEEGYILDKAMDLGWADARQTD